MSNRMEKIKSFQLQHWIRKHKLVPAFEVLIIANSVTFLGLFIYQLINPQLLFLISTFGVDFGIITIGFIWLAIIFEGEGVALLVFGWTIAGIYAKQTYGKDSGGILFKGAMMPVLFIFFTAGYIIISILISQSIISAIFSIVYFLIGGMILSGLLTFGGLIISIFVGFKSSYEMNYTVEPDYLVLPVVPSGEKVRYCPFRSKTPGCSYLGYEAPDKPLICDYQSSYLRCRVYAHIYEKLEVDK